MFKTPQPPKPNGKPQKKNVSAPTTVRILCCCNTKINVSTSFVQPKSGKKSGGKVRLITNTLRDG